MKIPIATYTLAMRVATKYSMDDVQAAIVRVINSLPSNSGIGKAIAQLAFVAEFSGHFFKYVFKEVFRQACSTNRRPSGPDLKPLMAFPNLVALMMQCREGIIQPNQAIWNEKASSLVHGSPVQNLAHRRGGPSVQVATPAQLTPTMGREWDNWLEEQLKSLGLAPFLVIEFDFSRPSSPVSLVHSY
jgi:hypothetical protein